MKNVYYIALHYVDAKTGAIRENLTWFNNMSSDYVADDYYTARDKLRLAVDWSSSEWYEKGEEMNPGEIGMFSIMEALVDSDISLEDSLSDIKIERRINSIMMVDEGELYLLKAMHHLTMIQAAYY